MKSMFDEFFYPDGTQVDFESTMRLQKFFMEWFRKEREKELLTFPVLTASVLEKEDGTGFVDDEFVHYCADEMEKGLSFFVYQSKSADSLASCCFSGDTKVDIVTDRYSIMTFKDAYKHFKNKTVTTTLDGDNAKAKIVRLPKGKHQMYKLTFKDGKTLVCTDNHIHVTDDGDKDTTELTVGTKLIKYNGFTIIDKIEKIDIKDRYVYCFEMEDKKNPYFNLASGIKTHNCRLRNELAENDFSYTLGAGGVITGSSQVITINANRLFQRYGGFKELPNVVDRLHKYLTAFKALYKGYIDAGLLPTYTAGVMDIDKQFVTIGINGMVEAAESQGIEATNNPEYKEFLQKLLGTIKDKNTEYRHKTGIKVNTECVPAENLGVKNAKWDKEDGLFVPRDCYNSYFYKVEDTKSTILDKLELHGDEITRYLDGGSALHSNLSQLLTKEQFYKLFRLAQKHGVPYWTFNVKMTCCNDCGYIDVETRKECSHCHSDDVYYATRVIGYLKPVKNFSSARQEEEGLRFYE